MTVVLFCCDYYFSIVVTNLIARELCARGCKVVLVDTGSNFNRRFRVKSPALITFCSYSAIHEIVYPLLDQYGPPLDENGQLLSGITYPCRFLAEHLSLKYITTTDVNDTTVWDQLGVDGTAVCGVAVRFNQIMDLSVIGRFQKTGFLWNLHGGMLPRYRGLQLIYRAIDDNSQIYGWTLHELVPELDAGSIIDSRSIPLDLSAPLFDLSLRLCASGSAMVLESLNRYLTEYISPPSSDVPKSISTRYSGQGIYYPSISEQEFALYEARGIRYVNCRSFPIQIASQFTREHSPVYNEIAERVRERMRDLLP